MRFRIVLLGPSVANYPTMHEAFQHASTSRDMRGIGSVLRPVDTVFCQSYENCGRVGWRGPDVRWKRVLPVVSPIQSRLILGHCFGEYSYCALRHGVVLLSRCPPEQV